MIALLITIHVIACVFLIGIILIQSGRGGGLVESFSNVESMFGPKTSTFLTRSTTVLSIVFLITCLSLAFLSARQSRSLLRSIKPAAAVKEAPVQEPTQQVPPANVPQTSAPAK